MFTSLAFVAPALAFLSQGGSAPLFLERSIELSNGYRCDYLNWEFKDPSLNLIQALLPAISSEEIVPAVGFAEAFISQNDLYRSEWNQLRMVNTGISGRVVTRRSLYGRLGGNFAEISHGRQQSKGLLAGGVEFLFNVPRDDVQGYTWDLSGAAGFQFCLCDGDFLFSPLLGFAYNDIHLSSSGSGRGHLSLFESDIEWDICYLNTHYNCRWTGPYLGFDAVYRVNDAVDLFTGFEYHWADYRAYSSVAGEAQIKVGEMSINASNCAEFNHYAYARGLFWNLGGNYYIRECWSVGFKFSSVDWRTFRYGRIHSNVKSKFYLDNDLATGQRFEKDATLLPVNWDSCMIELTFRFYF